LATALLERLDLAAIGRVLPSLQVMPWVANDSEADGTQNPLGFLAFGRIVVTCWTPLND